MSGIETSEIPETLLLSLKELADRLTPQNAYNKARELARGDKYRDAIPYYLSSIERRKQNREEIKDSEYSNLGFAYMKIDDIKTAITYYEKALCINPNNTSTQQNIANAYRLDGRMSDAKDMYEILTKSGNLSAVDANRLGMVYGSLGGDEKAVATLELSLMMDPKSAITLSNLGNRLANMGRFDEAREALERSQKLDPNNYGVYNNLGLVAFLEAETLDGKEKIAKLEEAKGYYERALNLKNNSISTGKLQKIDELLSAIRIAQITL